MSYIDTIRHERLGTLVGLALYHPFERRAARRSSYDFGCSPFNLVLGGGSGEHPAIVVHHLHHIVRYYVLLRLEMTRADGKDDGAAVGTLESRILEVDLEPLLECLEFCGWTLEQLANLVRSANDPTLPAPYNPDVHSSVEHWLAYSFGEFLWYDRPDLAGGEVEALKAAEPCLEQWMSAPVMRNVLP